MKLETAQSAAQLVPKIQALQSLIEEIAVALAERWPITSLKFSAPAEGASVASGTTIDLLPAGPASDDNSQLALKTALGTYQAQLDALTKQLEAL